MYVCIYRFQRDAMKFKPWLPKHRRKHKQSKDLPNTFVYGTTDYELPIVKTEQSMKLQAIKEAQEIIKSRPSSPGELRNNNIDDASLSATTTSDKFESDEIKIKNKLRREIYKDSKFFKKYGDMTIEDDDRYNYLRVRPNSGTDAHCRPSSGPGLRVRIDYSKPLQSAKSSVEGEHRQHFFNDDVSASNSTTRLSSVGSMTSKSTDRGLSMLKRVREENRIKREEDQRNKGKAFSKIHATTTGEKHTLSNNLKKHTKSGPALATPATSIFGEEADSVVAKALANANMEAAIIAKARQEHALNAFAPSVAAKKESQDEEKEHIPKAFAPKMFKRAATVREIQLKNNLSEMPEVHSRQKKREETQPKIIDVESRISTPKPNTSIIKAIKKDKQNHINDLTKKSIKHLNYFPSIPNRLK